MPIQKVTSGIIADGAIVATDIADGTVTGPKLGANSVSSNNIIASVTLTTPRISGNLNLDTAGTTGIRVPAANTIAIHTAGAEDMRIDASGNIGIGTSSPADKLSVVGNVRIENAGYFSIYNADNTTFSQIRDSGGAYVSQMEFYTAGAERMRITNGGNVLVGKSADNATTLGVQITSGIVNSASSSDFWNSYSTTAGVYRFYVTNAGTVTATSTTISAISDQRLKENIRDLDDGLDAIMSVKPRRFDWKEGKGLDKKDDVGFIAQEFEQVFPNSVNTSKAGADGIEYKTVNHGELIPTLVKAIQEQQAMIEELKTKVTALENANK